MMISNSIWILICILLLVIKYGFILSHENKRLYRLYEARDAVALSAIEGKISQDTKEYKFVINRINFALYCIKNDFDFSIKNIIVRPEKVKEYLDSMYDLLKKYDFLKKNYEISDLYLKKNLNFQLFVFINLIVKPICFLMLFIVLFLESTNKFLKNSVRFIKAGRRRINVMTQIKQDYYQYRKTI